MLYHQIKSKLKDRAISAPFLVVLLFVSYCVALLADEAMAPAALGALATLIGAGGALFAAFLTLGPIREQLAEARRQAAAASVGVVSTGIAELEKEIERLNVLPPSLGAVRDALNDTATAIAHPTSGVMNAGFAVAALRGKIQADLAGCDSYVKRPTDSEKLTSARLLYRDTLAAMLGPAEALRLPLASSSNRSFETGKIAPATLLEIDRAREALQHSAISAIAALDGIKIAVYDDIRLRRLRVAELERQAIGLSNK
jgi:hypothetical protein